jgi:hypothetical protein
VIVTLCATTILSLAWILLVTLQQMILLMEIFHLMFLLLTLATLHLLSHLLLLSHPYHLSHFLKLFLHPSLITNVKSQWEKILHQYFLSVCTRNVLVETHLELVTTFMVINLLLGWTHVSTLMDVSRTQLNWLWLSWLNHSTRLASPPYIGKPCTLRRLVSDT